MARSMMDTANNTSRATQLVNRFAEAMRLLVPYFENSNIAWKDCEQYDNYDRIADVLFRELVLHPLTYEVIGEEKSYQYDMPPYEAEWGGLRVRFSEKELGSGPLIRLVSINGPMDGVRYMEHGKEKARPIAGTTFELAMKDWK